VSPAVNQHVLTRATGLLLLMLVCFGTRSVFGQSVSGTIYGFVKDPQGASIGSAAVIARSVQTEAMVSTLSSAGEYYRLQNLIPSAHIIEINAPGFRTFISSPQTVSVSEPVRLNVALEIGTGAESITVMASSTRVNTVKEPDWNTLPANLPARVRQLLRRCLTKEPRNRLRDIGDARIA
jgi:hypothetical protein